MIDMKDLKWHLKVPYFVDAVFAANVVHIAEFSVCEGIFRGARELVKQTGLVIFYGPFKIEGQFTSKSN
jgi:hypothetical protein